jgi:hypothetical protein
MFEPVRLRQNLTGRISATVPDVASPPANQKIENLVLLIFWLLFLEGALRKWVAPQFSQYIFFVRDPFVLLLYWHALQARAFRRAGPLLTAGLVFASAALLLAFIQSVSIGDTRILTVMAYGWRQYFFYLPLPFAMAATLSYESLLRFARHALTAALVTAPLEFLQFHSAPAAIVNRGISDQIGLQFQSFAYTGGAIRPSGTFTSTVGVTQLIPSCFALLVAGWLTKSRRGAMRTASLVVAAAAIAVCLAFSGSRAAFVHVAIVTLGSLALGVITANRAMRARAVLLPTSLLALAAVLYPIVFPGAFELMVNRVVESYASESRFSSLGIVGRALYETVDFVSLLKNTPLAGYGLGLGGNGRTWLATGGAAAVANVYSESDWSRHIVDLGTIVGVMFIVYRIIFTISIFKDVCRATRCSASAYPMLLFGYVGIGLFYGQLTGHGTVGGFIWIYLGLCMASCRIALEQQR